MKNRQKSRYTGESAKTINLVSMLHAKPNKTQGKILEYTDTFRKGLYVCRNHLGILRRNFWTLYWKRSSLNNLKAMRGQNSYKAKEERPKEKTAPRTCQQNQSQFKQRPQSLPGLEKRTKISPKLTNNWIPDKGPVRLTGGEIEESGTSVQDDRLIITYIFLPQKTGKIYNKYINNQSINCTVPSSCNST